MRPFLLTVIAVLCAGTLWGVAGLGFQADVFGRAISVEAARNAVCSPLAIELDCALFGDVADALSREAVEKDLKVRTSIANAYQELRATFDVRTNGYSFVNARGFLVPEFVETIPAVRSILLREWEAIVAPLYPSVGAEAWFKSRLEGDLDYFRLPAVPDLVQYDFYDLVSFRVAWMEPFPTANTRTLPFHSAKDVSTNASFMCDIRAVDVWDARDYTMMRLPMKGGLMFYAILPNPPLRVNDIRSDVSTLEIENLVSVFETKVKGVSHEPALVVLPKMDYRSQIDLSPVFHHFKMPIKSIDRVTGGVPPGKLVQFVRFRLEEQGLGETLCERKLPERETRATPEMKRLVFNRPFLFFIHHPATSSLPLVGQFEAIVADHSTEPKKGDK